MYESETIEEGRERITKARGQLADYMKLSRIVRDGFAGTVWAIFVDQWTGQTIGYSFLQTRTLGEVWATEEERNGLRDLIRQAGYLPGNEFCSDFGKPSPLAD